jgi:mono/diheme cytochrome c family protein
MRKSSQKENSILRFYFILNVLCIFLYACEPKSEKAKIDSSTKFQQYYVQGEKLYLKHCSNCHQKNGTGLGLVYPPLHKSYYMDKNVNEVICLMRYGIKGELIVNGKTYNQAMPGIPTLGDLEIAEIATYIYNTWGHQKGLISVQDVTSVQNECKQ